MNTTTDTSTRKRVHFERDDSRLNTAVAIALLALLALTPILIALANSTTPGAALD